MKTAQRLIVHAGVVGSSCPHHLKHSTVGQLANSPVNKRFACDESVCVRASVWKASSASVFHIAAIGSLLLLADSGEWAASGIHPPTRHTNRVVLAMLLEKGEIFWKLDFGATNRKSLRDGCCDLGCESDAVSRHHGRRSQGRIVLGLDARLAHEVCHLPNLVCAQVWARRVCAQSTHRSLIKRIVDYLCLVIHSLVRLTHTLATHSTATHSERRMRANSSHPAQPALRQQRVEAP